MVNNLDWTAPLSAIDFLRDIGKHFRVNQMLAKEAVSARLNSDAGHQLHRVQLPDPAGHRLPRAVPPVRLHAADRRQRPVGQPHRRPRPDPPRSTGASAHALATPLITKADGTKFGKTEAGTVWLDPELTSPYAFYQFWLNADDRDVGRATCGLHLPLARGDRGARARASRERPAAREAQRALAEELTTLVHGARRVRAGRSRPAQALFGRGELADLDEPTLAAALSRDRRCVAVDAVRGRRSSTLLVATGLRRARSRRPAGRSPRAARTSTTCRSPTRTRAVRPADLLHGRWLRRCAAGKRSVGAASSASDRLSRARAAAAPDLTARARRRHVMLSRQPRGRNGRRIARPVPGVAPITLPARRRQSLSTAAVWLGIGGRPAAV